MTTNFKSLIHLLDHFKEKPTCVDYLAYQRWGSSPCCPHCGTVGSYVTNRGFKCKDKGCRKKFTVTTGTVFENTKIPLRYWFAAIYLATSHKKGISSLQLSRDLNITQKTAWFLLHRIRHMLVNNAPEMLDSVVEVDETYIGGKNKNRHDNKKIEGSQGRSPSDKTPVVGVAQKQVIEYIERDHKVIKGRKVKEKVVIKHGKVYCSVAKDTSSYTIESIINSSVQSKTKIVTDAYPSYRGLSKKFTHTSIKHTNGNYITVGEDNTNTIEGFWSLLKRGIIGVYHFTSSKHLSRYCHEFTYRYNTRGLSDSERFCDALSNSNSRLTYKQLIS